MNTGIIILAAGNSSRLGSPKQLLYYQGSSLLQRTVAAAETTAYVPIVLVLGAYADQILEQHPDFNINIIINDSWEKGISSSIAAGLSKMLELEADTKNVVIAVADQPFIRPEIFTELVEESQRSRKNIVASKYAETIGTPALFNEIYFDELIALNGNTGAKPLLQKYAADVATIPFELGHIDIDTQKDYNNLNHEQ
ncbi:nucleotidyltransferase family protein [Pedobacter psychroterrae]|uniref:Nucleotidyltransferase family protein n=1 Tax=Pedobacter psychroterrae TaxID=2530453 RepID=A0A4R0NIM1_9SPHI|nr:nucleotidyltransferase family protein [Pedobacter psychroterrae]TCD00492.1 nucleotidyltransferase family protein [Pedobacter psychroterrae]